MDAATLSIFIWGIYVLLIGVLLVFIPGQTLMLCGQENQKDHWPKIAGIIIVSLGYFCLNSAQNEVSSFYQKSIDARFLGLIGFIGLVFLKNG